ncbi:MAG: preprotein translocase subunit YajC [Bacteroidales bacterium]|nr:preprotein translocase subunit YajC [Bacteroidales bacterium]
MSLFSIFLVAGQQQGQQGSAWTTLIMLLLIIVVFWLFFIRPQAKRNRELMKFRQNLKKGDKIITIGGIHGKIIEVKDNIVIIESEGSRLRVEKNAIASEFQEKGTEHSLNQ